MRAKFVNEQLSDFSLKYEDWKKEGSSKGYKSWNLYKDGKLVAGISNNNNDAEDLLIRHIENFSGEKGLATKLIFLLLDKGVKIETGKPDYNSISTKAYYMNKKINNLVKENNYKSTILGKADNTGKEDYDPYIEASTKKDNYHYRWEK